MAEFSRLQSEIIACVRAADGLPIDHVTVRSPFDARVTYNLYSALTLIPRHQERHALQAERAASVPVAEPSPLAVYAAATPEYRSRNQRPSADPPACGEKQQAEDAHADPSAWIEARVQRVHEEREERVDVGRRLQAKPPADRMAIDSAFDVRVEGMTEAEDVLRSTSRRRRAEIRSPAPAARIASDA